MLVGDGGMGTTLLLEMGVPDDGTVWSAQALMDPVYHPAVRRAHRRFLTAGARVITTANYAIIPGYLKARGKTVRDLADLCATAGRLAWEAREEHVGEQRQAQEAAGDGPPTGGILIAGCLPPLLESHQPSMVLPDSEARPYYSAMAAALAPCVDVFLCETMNTAEEGLCAVAAARAACSPPKPVWLSLEGRLGLAKAPQEAAAAAAPHPPSFAALARRCLAERWPVELLSLNCAAPERITAALAGLSAADREELAAAGVRLGAYANRGREAVLDDGAGYAVQREHEGLYRPELDGRAYCDHVVAWVETYGVTYVAGCCGMGPAHIAEVAREIGARAVR